MQRCGLEWFWRMVGDPRRLVKRYAGDFVALAGLIFIQLAVSRIRPGAGRRGTVCNGIEAPAERITIDDRCDWGRMGLRVSQSKRSVIVLDCSELHRPQLSMVSQLMQLARVARYCQKKVALFGVGERTQEYLRRFGAADWLPMFSYPLALEAWVGKQTAILSERALTLRLPGNLTGPRVRAFGACVGEAIERVGKGQRISLSLDDVNRVSLDGMVTLARWCERFAGCQNVVTLSGGTPQIRENFRIAGLESYLSDSEMEATLSLGKAMVTTTPMKRPSMSPEAVAEEEDLVLDGETLWD
jgi:ABC-type transporter Mla MlaB component